MADQPHMPHSPVAETSTKQFGHIARRRSGTVGFAGRRSAAGRDAGRDAARPTGVATTGRWITGRCSAQ